MTLAGERLRRLVRGAAAAEIPPVGPIAAHQRQPLLRLLTQAIEEGGEGDEAKLDRRVGRIEAAEIGQRRLRRAVVVVADIGDLHHQEGVGVAAPLPELCPLRHARSRLVEIDGHPQTDVAGHAIDEAVIGEKRASARRLPAEGPRPRLQRMTKMLVDRHRQAADTVVEECVDNPPGQAVDVGVHRRADRNAEVAEEADRLEHVDDHAVVHERRHVPRHRRHLELAALHRRQEALAITVGRVLPPVERRPGHLAGPAEPALVRPVGRLLGDVERLIDEAAMQLEHDRLRMGVADIGVAVVDEEDFADHRAGISAPALGSA